jgi:two-component system, NarL family, sensor kinase
LRTLLVDIYPPDLHRTGLHAAVRDLVAPLGARGIDASVDVPDVSLPESVETLLYRCAQESLRNVVLHSKASHVDVRVELEDGLARLTVADDGEGFELPAEEGHFGLRLLGDLARESGGRLDVRSSPGAGTKVRIEAPL